MCITIYVVPYFVRLLLKVVRHFSPKNSIRTLSNCVMETLKDLITDYRKAEKATKVFYEAFKKLWFEENKPFGFETQEIRLGGLMLRLRSCGDRLEAFVNGEIDEIPELAEKLLDYNGGGENLEKNPVGYHWWANSVTPSIL